ncbi:MAG TPA: ABC transporter ATP-binding protein, partial [Ignavibacteriaceae bacterium]|nr:ABC transporter ATP-binding protein [Ignavibacteriaceae bacterium]
IVESPDFYGYLSAYKNLEIIGKISGREISGKRIMEVLELVGLDKRYKSKVKTYSHGMKQRLGIAQALIHNPDLIILDEPTTGLDPQGMKEIRDLIIHLSKDEKKTIFLSSHILYEVELVANRMIIINKGTTIIEGEVKDLLNTADLKVTFEVNDPQRAKNLIQDKIWFSKLDSVIDNKLIFNITNDEIPPLNRYFVENAVDIRAIVPKHSLEEFFLNITESAG